MEFTFVIETEEQLNDAIKKLRQARGMIKKAAKPWFRCETDGCSNTFQRGSGRRPKLYCCDTHRVRTYRKALKEAVAI